MQQYAVYANIVSVKSIFVVAWLSKLKTNSSSHWWATPGCLQQAYNSTAQLLQHSQLFLTFPTCRKGVVAFPGELFVSSTCWNVFDSSTGLALYTEKCIILAWQLQNTLHDRDICTVCVCVCMTNRKKIYSWQKATAQQLLQYVRVNNKCIAVITWMYVWISVFILCPPTLFLSLRCAYLMQRHTYTHTHNSAVDYTVTVV